MNRKQLSKTLVVLLFSFLFTISLSAQNKPMQKHPDNCNCETCVAAKQEANHVCTDECKANGCTHAKMETSQSTATKVAHVCTDEYKTKGCDFVKAKEARAALDLNKDGFIYECPMKCEPGSDKPGECSKCGMELKRLL